MTSLTYRNDRSIDEDDEYEYAGDDIDNARVEMYDDEEDDSNDDDEQIVRNNNNKNTSRNKSHTTFNDETNLIDYVIEEEKEIGGNKGEDSYYTSRSTTYSSLISNDDDEEDSVDKDDDEQSKINENGKNKKLKITAKEEGEMIRARAFLNRLDNKVREKDDAVKEIRESMYLTKEKIATMEKNKRQLEKDINKAQDEDNVTIVNRLCSELHRVEREIVLDHDVINDLKSKLDVAEMVRTKAIVERVRYNAEESVLKEKESYVIEQKRILAQMRQRQEDWKVNQMKRVHVSTLNTQKQAIEQQAVAQRNAIDEARRSKKVAHKYLQQTFEKIRTEKRNEEEASREETERKIKSLLNLRNAIERNKDAISIKLAQKRSQDRDLRDNQKREQETIESEGQNGVFYMLRKQKNEKLEQMQKTFSEQQELNRLVIVDKILKEENEKERKRRLYPEFYKKSRSSNISTVPIKQKDKSQSNHEDFPVQLVPKSELDMDPIDYASSMTSAYQHDEFDDDMDVDLAQPEFNGLWDKQPVKQEIDPLFNRSKHWKTKMDKDILQRTLTKLKENIVREQVVGAKRFEGTVPFKSDPSEIYFKDFDVGKVYRTRVTLTNVTLTINTLKLVDLSESLKDFIILKFEPPGMISAGMSCYLYVTFEPKINENLRGEIKFLAQTGPFTVPIRCEIKKVELSLDKTTVNVGTTVVDERLHQSITLRNNGGLGTNYRLVKTSLLRTEQANNQKEENKTKETTDTSDVTDLVQNEYIEVFTIKADENGFLAPHASISFPIEFSAPIAGTFHEEYTLIFDQNQSELKFSINAQSIDVPVWIENPSTDFKICMFDRLYQDALVLRNRSSAALRVSVDIQPRALQNHIEILPRTAYIQAKSSFSLQIKLIARPSIVDDNLPTEIFDPNYNTLIIPLEIKVGDQIRTVPFSISAVLTTSDLQFDIEQIDFGCCTTSESVVANINLKNNSLLAQPFGFVNLPDYIQVQPNDGFGTLLPEETIPLHVLFSPSATKEYRCTLTCKSLVNREFTIDCQGVGVLPPLSLSSTVIHFSATPINDQSIATFYVDNRHMDKNHFKHPVPRIGNGEFATVGATSFQFDVPENSPISISPLVGTVEPGTRQKITVRLAPKVDINDVRSESIRLKEIDLRRQMDNKDSPDKSDPKHKSPGPTSSTARRRGTIVSLRSDSNLSPAPENSNDWFISQLSVMKSFPSSICSFLIPCYIASGECPRPGLLNYDVANTLFLQVHCPIVRPELIVISDYGQTTIDFGSASIGQELSRTVLIQNITNKTIQLHSTLLNIDGPFRLLNALRSIEAGGTAPVKLTFTPNATIEFLETLELSSDSSKLTLCLKGSGLKPNVQLSFDMNNPFSMGCVLAKDYIEKTFQIHLTKIFSAIIVIFLFI
ncbi:unnamed protein product [Adineta steineri]|uniref:Uncharacterized protein n=1 Tax=Adineta steineri TaxID=433720 RepID=A0A819J3F0_9BILA|nr:unnamed protein product [Adineta steineri]